jgi:hypothetical protein
MAADVMRFCQEACSYELYRFREMVSLIDSCFDVAWLMAAPGCEADV